MKIYLLVLYTSSWFLNIKAYDKRKIALEDKKKLTEENSRNLFGHRYSIQQIELVK